MGIKEFLSKRLWGKPDYVPTWDPQCIRHKLVTIRLPAGWQFTKVEQLEFTATGPDCTVSFRFVVASGRGTRAPRPEELAAKPGDAAKLVSFIFNAEAKEVARPEGFLWLEAVDVSRKNKRLQIALVNTKPRAEFAGYFSAGLFVFHVTCVVPSTASDEVSFRRFDSIRSILRAAEWT